MFNSLCGLPNTTTTVALDTACTARYPGYLYGAAPLPSPTALDAVYTVPRQTS